MGGGNNTGMRAADGRYFFLLNSDAWVVGDGLDGSSRSPTRIPKRPSSARGCATSTGRCSARCAASRRSGGSRPSTSSSASSRPRSRRLNPLYAGGFDHDEAAEADWLFGPALLVRREAVDAVGLFDEDFFMFSEEVDWMTRFRRAGWKVLFFPGAEVVHVGGASHGGQLYVENLRGHLRCFDKHRGPREAERVRRLLLLGRCGCALLVLRTRRRTARACASSRRATHGHCSKK